MTANHAPFLISPAKAGRASLSPWFLFSICATMAPAAFSSAKRSARLWSRSWRSCRREMRSQFTREPAQLETALARIPALVAPSPEPNKTEDAKSVSTASGSDRLADKKETSMSVSASSDQTEDQTADTSKSKPKENDVLETETVRG